MYYVYLFSLLIELDFKSNSEVNSYINIIWLFAQPAYLNLSYIYFQFNDRIFNFIYIFKHQIYLERKNKNDKVLYIYVFKRSQDKMNFYGFYTSNIFSSYSILLYIILLKFY